VCFFVPDLIWKEQKRRLDRTNGTLLFSVDTLLTRRKYGVHHKILVIVLQGEVLLFQYVYYKFAIFVCAYTHTCVCARVSERVYARVCTLTHARDVSFSFAKAPYKNNALSEKRPEN